MAKRISREIALELLDKYMDDEITIMWEYSTNFEESRKALERKAAKYLEELEATELFEDYKEKIWH